EGGALAGEDLAMDDVMDGLTRETVPGVFLPQVGVAIDQRAARRGDAVGALRHVEAFEGAADGEELAGVGLAGDSDARGGEDGEAIALGVVVGQGVVEQEVAVVAAEPVAPVVADAPLLRQAGGGLDLAGVGADPDVAAADVDLPAGG